MRKNGSVSFTKLMKVLFLTILLTACTSGESAATNMNTGGTETGQSSTEASEEEMQGQADNLDTGEDDADNDVENEDNAHPEYLIYEEFLNGTVSVRAPEEDERNQKNKQDDTVYTIADLQESGMTKYLFRDLNNDGTDELLLFNDDTLIHFFTADFEENKFLWIKSPFYTGCDEVSICSDNTLVMVDTAHAGRETYVVAKYDGGSRLNELYTLSHRFKAPGYPVENESWSVNENARTIALSKKEFEVRVDEIRAKMEEAQWKKMDRVAAKPGTGASNKSSDARAGETSTSDSEKDEDDHVDMLAYEVIRDSFLYSTEEALRTQNTEETIRPLKKGEMITCQLSPTDTGMIDYLMHDNGYVDLADIGHDETPIVAVLYARSDTSPIYSDSSEVVAYCGKQGIIGITGVHRTGIHSYQTAEVHVYETWWDGQLCYLNANDYSILREDVLDESGVTVYAWRTAEIKKTPTYEAETVGFMSFGDDIRLHLVDGGASYVTCGDVKGYVSSDDLTVIKGDQGYPLFSLRCNIPQTLYSRPDTTSEVVASIPPGQGAKVLFLYDWNEEGEWEVLDYKGLRGYVLTDYEAEGEFSAFVTIKGSKVNVRSGPSTDDDRIGSVTRGESFDLEDIEYNEAQGESWFVIDYNGKKGYILSDYAE